METSLTFGENVDVFDLFITQVCSDNMGAVETTIIPPVTLSYNGELDSSGVLTMDFAMELACGDGGEPVWDCPDLNSNIGMSCQDGWGVVDENFNSTTVDRIYKTVVNNMQAELHGILSAKNMNRFQFYEAIVRVADFKFKQNKIAKTVLEGL